MKFNIILPTIRRPSLEAAIESVLAQKYTDYKLLVVIDGIAKYNEDDPLYNKYSPEGVYFAGVVKSDGTESSHNDSGACARNIGIEESRKLWNDPWIAYIDDDDIWHPNHLTTLVSLSTLEPKANMLRTAGQEYRLKHKHPRSSKKVVRLGPINTSDPLTVGMAHTREIFGKTPGWQNMDNHDHVLWHNMKQAGGISAEADDVTFIFKR